MLKTGDRVRILSKSIGRKIHSLDYEEGEIRKISTDKVFSHKPKEKVFHVLGDTFIDFPPLSKEGSADWFFECDLEKIHDPTEEISDAFDDMILDL